MIARITQFCIRNFIAWSAFKLGAFVGALIGMLFQTILVSLVLAGYDLTGFTG
jgi:hypothetical protein